MSTKDFSTCFLSIALVKSRVFNCVYDQVVLGFSLLILIGGQAYAGRDAECYEVWIERAVKHATAGEIAEAQRAVSTARSVAAESGGPMSEAEVLLRVGIDFFRLELFDGAAHYLEDVVGLLGTQDYGERGQDVLGTAYSYLVEIYGRFGYPDIQGAMVDRLECLVEEGGNLELLIDAKLSQARSHGMEAIYSDSEDFAQAWSHDDRQRLARVLDVMSNMDISDQQLGRQVVEGGALIFKPFMRSSDFAQLQESILRQVDFGELGGILSELAPLIGHLQHDKDAAVSQISGLFMKQGVELLNSGSSDLRPLESAYLSMALAVMESANQARPSDVAVTRCKEAVSHFESYVDEMRVEGFVAGMMAGEGHNFYRGAVDILARVSPEEAFFYAEKGRAWTLRRLLGAPRSRNPKTSRVEEQLLTEISAVEREYRAEPDQQEAQLLYADLESLRKEFEMVRLRGALAAGEDFASASDEPVPVKLFQQEILHPDSTLVAFFPGIRQLLIWAVDRDRIEMVSTSMPEESWLDFACQNQELRWEGSPPAARRAAKDRGVHLLSDCSVEESPSVILYRKLITPIAPYLRHRHLIVVPYGLLHYVPFAALRNPDTGRYLVQDFTLSLAPSAAALAQLFRRKGQLGGETLVLGDPVTHLRPLVGAAEEAEAIAELLGRKPILGEEATESRIYQHAGGIRLLHLATHGEYIPGSPIFSGMLLTADSKRDGALRMYEALDQLDLQGAELVVLSGCQTALGKVSRGDEVYGLPRAFLIAGSRAVISTLWPVDDRASAQLMVAFYKRYLRGEDVAKAIQLAQLELLEQGSSAAPYFWAGFTVNGDPYHRWSDPSDKRPEGGRGSGSDE